MEGKSPLRVGKLPAENPASRKKGDWGVDRQPSSENTGEKPVKKYRRDPFVIEVPIDVPKILNEIMD